MINRRSWIQSILGLIGLSSFSGVRSIPVVINTTKEDSYEQDIYFQPATGGFLPDYYVIQRVSDGKFLASHLFTADRSQWDSRNMFLMDYPFVKDAAKTLSKNHKQPLEVIPITLGRPINPDANGSTSFHNLKIMEPNSV